MGVSGISSGFPLLSQSSGQVGHVLLTRSPLGLLPEGMNLVRLACVKHAASVRPEPGSNSPSRLTIGEPTEILLLSATRSGDLIALASDGFVVRLMLELVDTMHLAEASVQDARTSF